MLKQLRGWGRIVAWSASGSLLANLAFGEVTWRTPWLVILGQASVTFVFATCCIALCNLALPRIVPAARRRFPFPLNWAVIALALIGLAAVGCAAAVVILTAIGHVDTNRMWAVWVFSLRTAVYFTVLFGIAGAIISELHARLDRANLVIRTKERDEADARRLAAEAQLASLEARVNPHFLFNTLNSIAELTHNDPAAAERMTSQLAALMRSSLDGAGTPLVCLNEELKLVRDYLDIERMRFGNRLRFAIDVDEGAGETRVPRLAVQTLVENSVKYAVSPRRAGSCLAIRVSRHHDVTQLDVEDDGPGFEASQVPAGHGLALLRSRLAMNFGERATLHIDSRPGRTCITLVVPA
jgi:hypothetical protein